MSGTLGKVFIAFAALSVAFYVGRFWSIVAAGELFRRFGSDWTRFYAQALAFRDGAGPRMYDLDVIDRYLQTLMAYYSGPGTELAEGPVTYPPLVAAAFVPFTLPPAPVGFALWLAVSIAAALFLAYRVWQFVPALGRVGSALAVLATVPVMAALFYGQPAILLAIPVGELFISLKAGRDFRSGLWLALLLLKPQFVVLFGLFLLWKRRWRAVAGAVVGGLIFVIGCVAVAGVPTLLRFPSTLSEISDLRNAHAGGELMMNWRALVLVARPSIDDQTGLLLVGALSALTMLLSLLVWRGAWEPTSPTFAPRFCALTLAALISSYHSHLHSAALLIVPLAAAWASPIVRVETRIAALIAMYGLTLVQVWVVGVVQRFGVSSDVDIPLWLVWPAGLPALLFVLAFGLMCRDAWGEWRTLFLVRKPGWAR